MRSWYQELWNEQKLPEFSRALLWAGRLGLRKQLTGGLGTPLGEELLRCPCNDIELSRASCRVVSVTSLTPHSTACRIGPLFSRLSWGVTKTRVLAPLAPPRASAFISVLTDASAGSSVAGILPTYRALWGSRGNRPRDPPVCPGLSHTLFQALGTFFSSPLIFQSRLRCHFIQEGFPGPLPGIP